MQLKNNILINIPHSSLYIPDVFYQKVLIDKLYLKNEVELLTDSYVDELFENENCNIIKANFSRIFCDVERFRNDKDEIMSRIGMGAVYNKTTKGEMLIKYNDQYKNFVLKNFYDKYHLKLNNITRKILEKYQNCVIIDVHSFSEELLKRTNIKYNNLPDVCIGFEKNFCDENIINIFKESFQISGFSVDFNNPYKGSIVPNNYYNLKDTRVKSIMIELNKNIYLNEQGNKNENFLKVRKIIQQTIQKLESNNK